MLYWEQMTKHSAGWGSGRYWSFWLLGDEVTSCQVWSLSYLQASKLASRVHRCWQKTWYSWARSKALCYSCTARTGSLFFLDWRVGPSRHCTQNGHMLQLGRANLSKGTVMFNFYRFRWTYLETPLGVSVRAFAEREDPVWTSEHHPMIRGPGLNERLEWEVGACLCW